MLYGLASGMETLCGQVHADACTASPCLQCPRGTQRTADAPRRIVISYFPDGWQVAIMHRGCLTRQRMLQAYGARNYGALGIVLQQAIVITTLTFGCTFLVWTQLHHVLLFAGLSSPRLSKPRQRIPGICLL